MSSLGNCQACGECKPCDCDYEAREAHLAFVAGLIIGDKFRADDKRFVVTDRGDRVIVALRIDEVQVTTVNTETKVSTTQTLTEEQARAEGWFNGPPYSGVEQVFDEYAQENIEPIDRSAQ